MPTLQLLLLLVQALLSGSQESAIKRGFPNLMRRLANVCWSPLSLILGRSSRIPNGTPEVGSIKKRFSLSVA